MSTNAYKTYKTVSPKTSPVTEKVKEEQVENSAHGFTFKVDDWKRLERFLILGIEGGTFYAGEKELAIKAGESLERCIQSDGLRTVNTIVEVSDAGKALKNDPAIFALAMCAGTGNEITRKAALAALPKVCRNGTHILHFANFVEQFRGWGRSLRTAVADWYLDKKPDNLAMQITKYASRDKWSHRDLLRLSHPKTNDEVYRDIFKYAVGKGLNEKSEHSALNFIKAVEELKATKDVKKAIKLIETYKLPREVVPTELLNDPKIWEALLPHMGATAIIRNLAKMTRVGLLSGNNENVKHINAQITNKDVLKNARIHPIAVLAAMKTYAQGHGELGKGTWVPINKIIDALDESFYLTFSNVEPTGKRILTGLDISGSMWSSAVNGVAGLNAATAACAMSLITSATESDTQTFAFTKAANGQYGGRWGGGEPGFTEANISPRQRLDDILNYIQKTLQPKMGGTDCSLPMVHATRNRIPVDTFIVWTDNETWSGIHPFQALRDYRNKMGIPAKLVVCSTSVTDFSIADPNDAGMTDIAGFSSDVPAIIRNFIVD